MMDPVIGILYPGEMGSSLGKVLKDSGRRVIATVSDRSERTQDLCRAAKLEELSSLWEVADQADWIFSLVHPGAALQVAREYAHHARAGRLYVDINSISPETVRRMEAVLAPAGIGFVDAAIHGQAAQLRQRATLYLSGARADEVGRLFSAAMRVKILGKDPGQASAFKMILAGMSKGLVSLFLEMGLLAQELGTLAAALEEYRHFYPGIMEALERLVPTYPQHAARRGEEMAELEQAMRSLELQPEMVPGAKRLLTALGELHLAKKPDRPEKWSIQQVIEEIAQEKFLHFRPQPLAK